jgi:hypothetical protein
MAHPELTEAELEAQLVRLTRSRRGGRVLQAKTQALKTLLRRRQMERQRSEREERERVHQEERVREREERFEWPSVTPDELAPVGYWPFGDGHPQDGAPPEEEELYLWFYPEGQARGLRRMTQGERDGQRWNAQGPPPWRRKAVEA